MSPGAGALADDASPSAGVFAGDASNVFYLPVMTVTGTREAESTAETPASVTVISGETVRKVAPAHPAEIMGRVPGVVVEPTTGEGHITGIRQPFGTSPVYLFLEDGVPIRSTGFFNHNALYEINIPQAEGLEVIRGPGLALYGSDAVGGTVNVLTRAPSLTPEAEARYETGSFGWLRGLATASTTEGDTGVRADMNVTHSDGWRDDTAYDRQSATLRADHWLSGTALLKTVITFGNIDQETGANSTLFIDDYKYNPTANYTPIAFRKVQAFRFSTAYENGLGDTLWSFTPYMRWNQMTLLPSWQLSYDPVVYTTGATSFGMLAKYRRDFAPWRTRLIVGTDLDYSPGFHVENKIV
jgi:outer membrane cobalamin receptor